MNKAHFEIGHSRNGTEFIVLDKLKGEANLNSKISYEYLHKTPYVDLPLGALERWQTFTREGRNFNILL